MDDDGGPGREPPAPEDLPSGPSDSGVGVCPAPGVREDVLHRQLRFLTRKRAGCLFAAVAARSPEKYGWVHRFPTVAEDAVDSCIEAATRDPGVTTLSMVFPQITTTNDLLRFLGVLKRCSLVTLEQEEEAHGCLCFGFRAEVGELRSYVAGFGNYAFLPKTRRTPSVEITMRVKPRPQYDFVFKEAPACVIHLADLDMRGMPPEKLWRLWDGSFVQTERILGHKPDLRSAARTTYNIPAELVHDIP